MKFILNGIDITDWSYLDIVRGGLEQLKTFQLKGTTSYLEADIRGYKEILKSNSEKNAKKFLELKEQDRLGKIVLDDNEVVVKYMKENNLWE